MSAAPTRPAPVTKLSAASSASTSTAAVRKRKIAILGSRSVGKSSLIRQFIENSFADDYYPTIETLFKKTITRNGVDYECELIDTAGQDETSILNGAHVIGIHGYVLVYSIAAPASFNMVDIIYNKLVDFSGLPALPCVVVGSKVDLEKSRKISTTEGQDLAKKLDAAWVETSSKNNLNVDKVFQLCLEEIERRADRNFTPLPSPSAKSSGSCVVM